MKLIIQGNDNSVVGYCYAGWFGQGCNSVCSGKCSQVCMVDMGPTQSPTPTTKAK